VKKINRLKKILLASLFASAFVVIGCGANLQDDIVKKSVEQIKRDFVKLYNAKTVGRFFWLSTKCEEGLYLSSCKEILSKEDFKIIAEEVEKDKARLERMKASCEKVMKKPSHQDILERLKEAFIENPGLTYRTFWSIKGRNLKLRSFSDLLSRIRRHGIKFEPYVDKAKYGAGIHTLLRPEETEKALEEMFLKRLEKVGCSKKEIEKLKGLKGKSWLRAREKTGKILSSKNKEDSSFQEYKEKVDDVFWSYNDMVRFLGVHRIGRKMKVSKVRESENGPICSEEYVRKDGSWGGRSLTGLLFFRKKSESSTQAKETESSSIKATEKLRQHVASS